MIGTWPERAETALRAHGVDHRDRTRRVVAAPVVQGVDPTRPTTRREKKGTSIVPSLPKASAKTATSASTDMLLLALSSRRMALAVKATSVALPI